MDGAAYAGVVAFTAGIFAILFIGVQRRDTATTVNAGVSIVVVVLPLAVGFGLLSPSGQPIDIDPALPLWIAAAGFLHSLGMVGLYERIWWWDHLTHTLSAAFVAAVIYASLVVVGSDSATLASSAAGAGLITVLFTFWVGVFWEFIELIAREIGNRFDIEPILVHYGWRDTAYDLGFNVVGATLVAVADLRVFVPIARRAPESTELFLFASAGVTTIGSVLMALFIGYVKIR